MLLKDYLTDEGNATRFARKINVSRQAVHNYMRGDIIPRVQKAMEIEIATNRKVTLYDWVDRDGNALAKVKGENTTKTEKVEKSLDGLDGLL